MKERKKDRQVRQKERNRKKERRKERQVRQKEINIKKERKIKERQSE